ncbi:MAG: PP2C family protein-serine/threonine phosphatase, partial [Myxococcota bacterium]
MVEPYVVVRLDTDPMLDLRLMMEPDAPESARLPTSRLGRQVATWEVTVYSPERRSADWTYRARVAVDGELLELRLRLPKEEAGDRIPADEATRRARELLAGRGIDLARYEAPEVKSVDLAERTDTTVRFRDRERLLGDRLRYGVEVSFLGDRLGGFGQWTEDPNQKQLDALFQPFTLLGNLRFFSIFLLFPVVGLFFVRRYHEGVVGVDRSLRIVALSLAIGVCFLPMVARAATQDWSFGPLTRQQATWLWGVQMFVLYFVPQALVAALSWSVGESLCRERWGATLAAFDALIRRKWRNRTVAVSALRGLAAGTAIAACLLLYAAYAPEGWGKACASVHLGPWWESARWPGVAMVLVFGAMTLYYELFGRLFLVPLLTQKLGYWPGAIAATLVGGLIFWSPISLVPMSASLPMSMVWSGAFVFLFLRYDFLTSALASFTAHVVGSALPFLLADAPAIELQGALALLIAASPCFLTARYLASGSDFVYRYEDVPPHVRRIAERERQRVELETARNIQSSILPVLPSQLHGVELAHTYLPATEVGGDFYDVLALDDGRLAVAVGDVAGHGVSSGLVMSMAKSALAVQVSFDPEVRAVFTTLNRMVFQSARKRLLATLCYALVDPVRREIQFASAGHLFPYRIGGDGTIESLESIAYP